MPSVFTHAVAAAALGRTYAAHERGRKFWLLTAACAVLPDADVVAFAFGIPYRSVLGHRGLSHSLAFALAVGVLAASLFFREVRAPVRRRWPLALFFFAATASHGLLDALTDGGLGVAFFAPFDATRYFFPCRPIEVSPIGAGFFGARGLKVLASEFAWVWLPSFALVLLVWLVRRLTGRRV